MLKYRIHFEINGYDDYFIVQAETFEEVKEIAEKECEKRNLDILLNNLWSENIGE